MKLLEIFSCKHYKETIHDKHHMICLSCHRLRKLPDNLCIASGVFARIEDRIEDEREYNRLIKMGEEYFNDPNYNRGEK